MIRSSIHAEETCLVPHTPPIRTGTVFGVSSMVGLVYHLGSDYLYNATVVGKML